MHQSKRTHPLLIMINDMDEQDWSDIWAEAKLVLDSGTFGSNQLKSSCLGFCNWLLKEENRPILDDNPLDDEIVH